VPPANRVFEGQFVITFTEGDFPPSAENPAEQLTYRAIVEFSSWEGGFTEVSFLNTLTVDFEGAAAEPEPEVTELVIYYPDEPPPLATVEEVTITELQPGFVETSPNPYITTIFQGVNALQSPGNDDYEGPFWQVDSGSAFDLSTEPFTLEFWWRLGTSLPIADDRSESQVEVALGYYETGIPVIFMNLVYFGYPGSFYYPPTIQIQASDGNLILVNNNFTYNQFVSEDTISTEDATALNHLVIQRYNATDYTVHYKGVLLQSWSMPSISFTDIKLQFGAFGLNVPGAALSQIRITKSALYGTGTFTPPSTAFFTP
jgi:hypothetical protein